MKSAGLYVHVPFCKKKCNYCDFYSLTDFSLLNSFIKALNQEIDLYKLNSPFKESLFSTIYFGGGTPSLLPLEIISKIVKSLEEKFTFISFPEISLEANPGTMSAGFYQELLNAGINRLTLGIQSFEDSELETLGRIFTADSAQQSIKNARSEGFRNIGIDLIFAIPGQTIESWKRTLDMAISCNLQHISVYSLTIEPKTRFAQLEADGRIKRCSEDLEREMFVTAQEILEEAGFYHYEISNYSLPGFSSVHNRKYWNASPYLGLGPSAHSFFDSKRWWNIANVKEYCQFLTSGGLPFIESETLTKQQQLDEMIMLGLRCKEGIPLENLKNIMGKTFDSAFNKILEYFDGYDTIPGFCPSLKNTYLSCWENSLCLTLQGLLVYNSVCQKIVDILAATIRTS